MRTFFFLLIFSPFMTIKAQEKEPSLKHFWHTSETTATPASIWNIWTDVDNWHEWDTGLKQAELTTPFELHGKGIITSLEDRKSKFKIVDFQLGKSYTFKTNLPLGALYVKRHLQQRKGKVSFTHEVWFSGLTGRIFAKQFGPSFKEMLPQVMENIRQLAEEK